MTQPHRSSIPATNAARCPDCNEMTFVVEQHSKSCACALGTIARCHCGRYEARDRTGALLHETRGTVKRVTTSERLRYIGRLVTSRVVCNSTTDSIGHGERRVTRRLGALFHGALPPVEIDTMSSTTS